MTDKYIVHVMHFLFFIHSIIHEKLDEMSRKPPDLHQVKPALNMQMRSAEIQVHFIKSALTVAFASQNEVLVGVLTT